MVVIHIDVLIVIAYTNICVVYYEYVYYFKKNGAILCVKKCCMVKIRKRTYTILK